MKIITASSARQNFFEILDNTISHNQPTHITTKRGNAVLISEEDYEGFLETVYLMSSPQTSKEILEGIGQALEDCVDEALVDWDV